jgi:hypothetical protein
MSAEPAAARFAADATARFATAPVVSIAAAFGVVLFLPAFSESYGYFLDELYYLACARHLAPGYVDHPPLAPLILRAVTAVLGDSIPALRLLPALAGGAVILLTGSMAQRMGGGARAQTLAVLCVAFAPIPAVVFSFFSMNAFEVLIWTAIAWLLVELCRSGEVRLWLPIGVLLGVGFENKHTIALIAGGVAVATLATPLRRHLAGRWPWLGALAAIALALPNIGWQIANGWPSLEFYENLERESNIWTSPPDILVDQILVMSPATAPVWIAGAVTLFSSRARRYRPLGWLFLTLLVTFVFSGLSRPDRIAGAYPVAFAAGGIAWERLAARRRLVWTRIALPAGVVGMGALFAPVLFAFPPEIMERHPVARSDNESRREVGSNRIPINFAHRMGWEEMVAEVARVHAQLTPQEQRAAVLLADDFGTAGALELFGPRYGLPGVYSPHNSYTAWGPGPDANPPVVIGIGIDEAWLERAFQSVEVVAFTDCAYCMGWRKHVPIQLARSPRRPLGELWPELRRIGLPGRKLRLLASGATE